ncbi:pentatricopeptide repeat-containing protein [Panicum miliaceum]|uniref:Pentatricopeptide repeat-containing protein n=1 Tax=Panicum miliaceum TaxID=4540 RepID=A0A3L6TT13_PANMI|nr:pentatricopeptide repeat-containing protein [Panicum miliaceum]
MCRWGVSPSRSDHHAVLDALLREGMAAEAYEVVAKEMDADGARLGLPEFEQVLRPFRERGSLDAIEQAFDEMLLRGLMPGVRVYDVYVGALCDKGDLAGVRRMLGCMERTGCPPGDWRPSARHGGGRVRGRWGHGRRKGGGLEGETVLAVAEVLRRSSTLRISEDGKKDGRAKELLKPDEIIEQVDSRTIVASPLPYNVKLGGVESFFAQCGKVQTS